LLAASGAYEVGARSTVEGQSNWLCVNGGSPWASGSFEWVSLQNGNPNWAYHNGIVNIVQVGYGICTNANNGLGLGTVCDGHYHWYWAWGSYCGSGSPSGTAPGYGPVAIRIGASLSSPPPTRDMYIARHVANGAERYEGFVGGVLLTGVNALGQNVSASVPASSLCWDLENSNREFFWFGETFNNGDSMGGWTGVTRNHLDYTSVRYSINTGWLSPGFGSGPCNVTTPPVYTCTLSGTDRFYVDTNQ
jgi:hypothetical protein